MSKYECSQETTAVAIRNANLISIAAYGRNIQEHGTITKASGSLLLSPEELEGLPSPSVLKSPSLPVLFSWGGHPHANHTRRPVFVNTAMKTTFFQMVIDKSAICPRVGGSR